MAQDPNSFLRHLLATIAYRLAKSVRGVDVAFYSMESVNGIRTPGQILAHMSQVMNFTLAFLAHTERIPLTPQDGPAELDRFYGFLKRLDQVLAQQPFNDDLTHQLIQGPLADVLTHVGQLSLLRRYMGEPVKGENFMKARIRKGVIDREAQDQSNELYE
jgi:hypothetical protein